MGKFAVGDVILCQFPFSDLSSKKVRPAVIVAVVDFDDLILCQITSSPYSSSNTVTLCEDDFESGNLPIDSFMRPDKLFTADSRIVKSKVGSLSSVKSKELLTRVKELF